MVSSPAKKNNRLLTVFIFAILVINLVLISKVSAGLVRTPSSVNMIDIISPEKNQFLNNNDPNAYFSRMGGTVGDFVESLERIVGTVFSESYYVRKEVNEELSKSDILNSDYAYYISDSPNYTGGVLGMVSAGNNILISQRPASGSWFMEQKIYALTNPGKVYAQEAASPYYPGLGFDLLRPIYGFWGWAVNVVFGFLILLIIVIAFAIMFQQRLGAKTAITLQTAIPSIALAMILIPFSYAISGAFIDLLTLGTNVVHGFILGPGSPGRGVYDDMVSKNISAEDCARNGVYEGDCNRGLYADDWRVGVLRFREQMDLRPTFTTVGESLQLNSLNFILPILNVLDEQGATGQTSPTASAWFGAIINLVLSILMIWYGIKTFIILFGKYLTLIILPIASPFIFASVAIPGTGTKNVMMYAKRLGAASLSYIVTYGILLLTIVLTHQTFLSTLPELRSGAFVPPLLGLTSAIGGGSTTLAQLLFTLIGLGMYFSLPKILAGVDKTLGVSGPLLPDFVKTPLEGLKESWNVTRGLAGRAVRAPFAVPGLAAKGLEALDTAREGLNLNAMRNRWIARRQERAGIGQDSEYSARYEHRKELENKWAQTKRNFDASVASGDRRGALRYKNEMDALDKEASRNSISLSHSTKPEDKVALTATFKMKDGDPPNMFILTPSKLDEMWNLLTGTEPGSIPSHSSSGGIYIRGAELILEAKKFAIPPNPLIEVYYSKLVAGSSQDLESDVICDNSEQFSYAAMSSSNIANIFGLAPTKSGRSYSDFIRIIADNSDLGAFTKALQPDYYEGKNMSIPMVIQIGYNSSMSALEKANWFKALFGEWQKNTGRYVGGDLASSSFKFGTVGLGAGASRSDKDPNKRIFKVNGKESNAITVTITKST